MTIPRRKWDRAIPREDLDAIIARRQIPDGKQRYAQWDEVTERWRYPWDEMEEGDFFIVQIRGSIESMKVLFRQTAARKDFEVAVLPMTIDGVECLRATRVLNGIAALKKEVGFKAFNVKARRAYLTAHGKKNKVAKPKPERKTVPVSEPTEPVVGKTKTVEDQIDLLELRQQRILAARREAAGLPVDQPDFMGVQKK